MAQGLVELAPCRQIRVLTELHDHQRPPVTAKLVVIHGAVTASQIVEIVAAETQYVREAPLHRLFSAGVLNQGAFPDVERPGDGEHIQR